MTLKSPGNPGLFYDIGKFVLSYIIKRSASYAQVPGKRSQESKSSPKRRAREAKKARVTPRHWAKEANKARVRPNAGREEPIKQEFAQTPGKRCRIHTRVSGSSQQKLTTLGAQSVQAPHE